MFAQCADSCSSPDRAGRVVKTTAVEQPRFRAGWARLHRGSNTLQIERDCVMFLRAHLARCRSAQWQSHPFSRDEPVQTSTGLLLG